MQQKKVEFRVRFPLFPLLNIFYKLRNRKLKSSLYILNIKNNKSYMFSAYDRYGVTKETISYIAGKFFNFTTLSSAA